MREPNYIDLSGLAVGFTQRQSGFTLVEVLVSALLLAIGMVGLAGLQAA
ncbi:MAG: prepilin-type N-terminal cleavage/methylation domain-containing protein, partial [Lysobacterales bacterium]